MSDPGPDDNSGAPLSDVAPLIEIEGADQALRRLHCGGQRAFTVGSWRGRGLPGTERRRQVDHDAHARRVHDPDRGHCPHLGHDVQTDGVAARRALGFLPEGAPTYPEMSVSGFLRFCARIRGYRRRRVTGRVAHALGLTPWRACGCSRSRRCRKASSAASAWHRRCCTIPGAGAGRTDRRAGSQPKTRSTRADPGWRRTRRSSSRPISSRRSTRSAPARSSSRRPRWWPTPRRRPLRGNASFRQAGRCFPHVQTPARAGQDQWPAHAQHPHHRRCANWRPISLRRWRQCSSSSSWF